MMTRKHFVALAAMLKLERGPSFAGGYGSMNDWQRGCYDQWSTIALNLAAVLAQDNPRFDRSRFLAACGVSS